MDAAQQPVEAALEHDIAGKRQIAPGGELEELKNASIEGGHCAVGRKKIEVRLKQGEEVERAERKAAGRDPHEKESEPRSAVEQFVEQLQERHRSPRFAARDDSVSSPADVIVSLAASSPLPFSKADHPTTRVAQAMRGSRPFGHASNFASTCGRAALWIAKAFMALPENLDRLCPSKR
jgi:hypothetical protein